MTLPALNTPTEPPGPLCVDRGFRCALQAAGSPTPVAVFHTWMGCVWRTASAGPGARSPRGEETGICQADSQQESGDSGFLQRDPRETRSVPGGLVTLSAPSRPGRVGSDGRKVSATHSTVANSGGTGISLTAKLVAPVFAGSDRATITFFNRGNGRTSGFPRNVSGTAIS